MTISHPALFEEIFGAPKPTTLDGLYALGIGATVGFNPLATEAEVVEAIINSLTGFYNDSNLEEMNVYYDENQSPYI